MHDFKPTHTISYGSKPDDRVWEICAHKRGAWRLQGFHEAWNVKDKDWLAFAKEKNMIITDLRTRMGGNE